MKRKVGNLRLGAGLRNRCIIWSKSWLFYLRIVVRIPKDVEIIWEP